MRIGTVLSIGLAVLTATAAIALAVFSAVCTACGHVPTHHVAAPPTPGIPPSSAIPTPQANAGGNRLSRALLTRLGSARVIEPARTGPYRSLADVPLQDGPIHQALAGQAPVTPRGCGPYPPARWSRTAGAAPAATVTLTIGRAQVHLRETLLRPRARPAGLVLPARCQSFTFSGGIPARSAPLHPTGVGDVAHGTVTLAGRTGTPHRAILYTIVFRAGHVYGVIQTADTGPNPGGTTVRKAALLYARRAAARARGLA